jgi:Fur family transcriptional regulator, zinc uptake regulator
VARKKVDRANCCVAMLQRRGGKMKSNRSLVLRIAFIVQLGYDCDMNVSRETRRETLPEMGDQEGPGAEGALATALALCRRNKISLTPGRRRILEILAREGRPLGAYEMIDRVAQASGKRPAPISIYRALDFLLENSLIHRLASRNAYLACGHGHAAQEPIVFLICEVCGKVVEATSGAMRGALGELAAEAKFSPRAQVMEVAGRCRCCAAA